MSIQSEIMNEIERVSNNISNAYDAAEDMGAQMPTQRNSDNLESTVRSIPKGASIHIVGGNTRPALPLENTIWVKNATVTGRYIISTQTPPTVGKTDGDVWVYCGTYGSVNMKISEDINISVKQIFILAAGVWGEISAEAYTTQWVEIFGGRMLLLGGSGEVAWTPWDASTGPSGTQSFITGGGNTPYAFDLNDSVGNSKVSIYLHTDAPYDVTNYSSVEAKISNLSLIGVGHVYIVLATAVGSSTYYGAMGTQGLRVAGYTEYNASDLGLFTIDVSELSGSYYIGILAASANIQYISSTTNVTTENGNVCELNFTVDSIAVKE